MALQRTIDRIPISADGQRVLVRIRAADECRLEKHLFQRYPNREWGTFFRFGWRRTCWGIAISYVDGMWPEADDLDRQTGLTTFRDQYTRRAFAASSDGSGLGVGVVHSHPEGVRTSPSSLDDDMDRYFSRELSAYGGGMPYCSLILQRSDSTGLTLSGRVYDRGLWLPVSDLIEVGTKINRLTSELNGKPIRTTWDGDATQDSRTARLQAVMGAPSAERLRSAVVGVVGCSGTGSPAIEILAKAGVGEFVLVDPERLSRSNLERVHGAVERHLHLDELPFKVDLMRDMIAEINPNAVVTALLGNILHDNVIDELLRCDLILGCVDSNHGRAALSDMATHYLLPALDIGVSMSGISGRVTEQVVEFTQLHPDLPCAFCGGRINTGEMAVELMSDAERAIRQCEAEQAAARGDNPDQYWHGEPRQLHTVGYLTTAAGALGAGYAEGWLTGAFEPPHTTFQFDPSKFRLGCVAPPRERLPDCSCGKVAGWGNAARSYRNVAIPSHWPRRAILRTRS